MKPSGKERLKSIEHIDRIIHKGFVESFNHGCFSDEQLDDMEKEIMSDNIQMSDYPQDRTTDPNGWEEMDKICPSCKAYKMWTTGWYDGHPEDGGACIGTEYLCGNCNHHETF